MANDSAARNLDHIYFFVAKPASDCAMDAAHRSHSPESNTLSRSTSPSTNSSDGSGTGSSSSSTHSLNPNAAFFKPTTLPFMPKASPLYELREIPGKGLGLFATALIPQGTCLISEAPLLRIQENALTLAWFSYCGLSAAQRKAFDALHLYKPQHLNLEHASRMHLIDRCVGSMDPEDYKEIIQDQVRVMSTFACNNFQCGEGLAVFATTARLNHSCVPNVHHSFNPTLQKQTVYAMRPIQPGEELCTTYLGGGGAYQVRAQRIESLRTNYGFTCACPACTDVTGQSDGRRELMGSIAYGLQVFQYGGQVPEHPRPWYVPASPKLAISQAEDFISMLIGEGILSIELCKAYRMASMIALGLKDFDKAKHYAFAEADVEKICLGSSLDDLEKSGVAAACWLEMLRKVMVKARVIQPDQKLKKPLTEQQQVEKNLKGKQKRAKRTAQKAEQARQEQEKNAARKARQEAQKEEERKRQEAERKRKEYDASFPGLN